VLTTGEIAEPHVLSVAMSIETNEGTQLGARLDDVPLSQRFCNNCDRKVTDDDAIGDLWWEGDPGPEGQATILCRNCA
jgi:hypothetical protein